MNESPTPDPQDSSNRPANHPDPAPPAAAAGFFTRLGWLFLAPSRLGDELRERPTIFFPALLGLALTMASVLLIPTEMVAEMMRTQQMQAGGDVPALSDDAIGLIRIAQAGGLLIFWWVILAAAAGIYSVIFAFILGDEGRYRQYMSAAAWGSIIAALGSLLLTPLRIATGNPQLTLSPGTFLGTVMSEGYLLRVANGLDFFAIWSWIAAAVLISKIDPRRSTGSAVVVVCTVWTLFIMGISIFSFGG